MVWVVVMGKDPCLCPSLDTPTLPCMVVWVVDMEVVWAEASVEVMECPKGPQCMVADLAVDSAEWAEDTDKCPKDHPCMVVDSVEWEADMDKCRNLPCTAEAVVDSVVDMACHKDPRCTVVEWAVEAAEDMVVAWAVDLKIIGKILMTR